MKNLVEALETLGACGKWHMRAETRSARELFDLAWDESNGPVGYGHHPLAWLAEELNDGSEPCFANDNLLACLLGLPFRAWADAVESYLAKARP